MWAERAAVLAADWFPGQPASVRKTREFVHGVLGEWWPGLDDVLVMVSEIASNAIRHTASAGDGWFDVTVSVTGRTTRVAVADRGSSSEPRIPDDSGDPDALTGGRGLRIVDTLADRWGYGGDELGRGGLVRGVGFPELIAPVLRWHLSCFGQDGDDGLVFTGPAGALLRRGNFRRRTWLTALAKAELSPVHFHDLRHTGNNLTATAGANLRELMARMGHSSTRAALIYLHSTDERQREIADALGDLAAGELKRKPSRAHKGTTGGRSGTHLAQGTICSELLGTARNPSISWA